MKRIHLIISGDVIGVGYRAWATQRAREAGLTGWVKNREDRAVEIVAEGDDGALTSFIAACKKGPDVAWVQHIAVNLGKATGEFVDFEVVY